MLGAWVFKDNSFAVIFSILSVCVAAFVAWTATRAIRAQLRALKWRANHDFHLAAWNILGAKPSILKFHGIDLTDLERDGFSIDELIYLCLNFDAGAALYNIGGDKSVELTHYRKHLLDNPKVRIAWKKYLRDRFFNPTPFTRAIEDRVAELDRRESLSAS
jgi:hypothetical protein